MPKKYVKKYSLKTFRRNFYEMSPRDKVEYVKKSFQMLVERDVKYLRHIKLNNRWIANFINKSMVSKETFKVLEGVVMLARRTHDSNFASMTTKQTNLVYPGMSIQEDKIALWEYKSFKSDNPHMVSVTRMKVKEKWPIDVQKDPLTELTMMSSSTSYDDDELHELYNFAQRFDKVYELTKDKLDRIEDYFKNIQYKNTDENSEVEGITPEDAIKNLEEYYANMLRGIKNKITLYKDTPYANALNPLRDALMQELKDIKEGRRTIDFDKSLADNVIKESLKVISDAFYKVSMERSNTLQRIKEKYNSRIK